MSVEIKVKIGTPRSNHEIVLPQDQNTFDKTLSDTGFYYYDKDEYAVREARSGLRELDAALEYARDIEELNYLAQILSHFNESEMEDFADILKADGNIPTMPQVINMAYNVNNMNFNIEHAIYDIEDLGAAYAEDNDPAADEIILQNTDANGGIDYEGIGVDLQLSQGGVFSDAGYIANYDEMVKGPYDGKFFPPFYYGGDVTLALGVTLTKRGEDKGVDIFLPAEGGVLRRATHRVGAGLDRCEIKPCWGFPFPLAGKTLMAPWFGELNAVAQRLSVLTPNQLRDVFTKAENAGIENADEFCEFCSEKIREIQMPEAVNTVTYYFPLDIKLRGNEDYDNEDEDYDPDYTESISSSDAIHYMDEIFEQIAKDNSYFDTNRLLAEYFHDKTLDQKVYSMLPTVEEHGGELWGAMVMKVAGELTPGEISGLKDYITGQNSDGYGESLEQHEIKVSDGELYVSFWSGEKGYAVYTQDEFNELQRKRQTTSGGTRQSGASMNGLPDCPMIGADGNVFNLMGLASRTLKQHGMADKAKEMSERVTSSGSYDAALAILTEYVNPVSKDDMRHSGGYGMTIV